MLSLVAVTVGYQVKNAVFVLRDISSLTKAVCNAIIVYSDCCSESNSSTQTIQPSSIIHLESQKRNLLPALIRLSKGKFFY